MSTDDESFHPLGQEWEDELEGMLDETEYDSDLGMQMAQDAMRVTKGELSEAEFHEMYHEDVMEEFGEDQRPTEDAYETAQEEAKGTMGRMLDAFDGDGEESRRSAMKKMGVGATAVGFGAWGATEDRPEMNLGTTQEGDGDSGEGTQLGMVLDLERCDGCLSCVTACSEENQLDQGVNWMYILDFEEPGEDPGRSRNRLIRPCQHCTDAPCEKVCPTTARHTRDSDGLVLTDYDVCIGCRYCQVACPYGVNYFQWEEPDVSTDEIADNHGVEPGEEGDHMTDDRDRWVDSRAPRGTMSKCTMCPTRQDGHMGDDMVGTTACEEACPPDAINFGDMNDPESKPQQYLTNVVASRAESMVDGERPNRADVEESYAFLDGDIELLEMEYLEVGEHVQIATALYTQGEISEDDAQPFLQEEYDDDRILEALEDEFGDEFSEEELEALVDALDSDDEDEEDEEENEFDDETIERARTVANAVTLRAVTVDILEDEFEDELDEEELTEEDLETLAEVLLGETDEGEVDADNLERAEDARDAVVTDAEDGVQDVIDRYESREITPAEVEESLLIVEGEEEPWVSEEGITTEEAAQQVLQSYAGGEASTFKLLEDMGTNPNVTYIGNEPGPRAEQVEGPVAYDAVGQTDNRKEVLDEGTVGDTGLDLGGW